MKGWLGRTTRYNRDFGTVIDMFPDIGHPEESDLKNFATYVKRNCSQLMLAATRPDQHKAVKALKEAGFERIATGRRIHGFGVVTLWGRYYRAKLKTATDLATLNCCGIRTVNRKYAYSDFPQQTMGLHIFPKKRGTLGNILIPEDYKHFASTDLADYYVENYVKFYNSLAI